MTREDGERPVIARVLGAGAKGAERITQAAGVNAALDEAIEEALVRALRSPGVERAIVRLVHRNAVQGAVTDALTSDEIASAIVRAIESETAERVWAEILDSTKTQLLIERIAESPEVRHAITSQGTGLITDIGVKLTHITEALDDSAERVLARARGDQETDQAGLVTRGLAAAFDLALAFLVASLMSTVLASVIPFAVGSRLSLLGGLILGLLATASAATVLVAFWTLAGQTPGMRFLSISLEHDDSSDIPLRCAILRLVGLVLAVLPLGLGILAIVRDGRRRGWHDRLAGTEVVYNAQQRAARRPSTAT